MKIWGKIRQNLDGAHSNQHSQGVKIKIYEDFCDFYTMEFPAEEWPAFEAQDFELAVPRGSGNAVMELMLQLRPNGRALDHFRVALGGNKLLAATVGFGSILPIIDLERLQVSFEIWAKDVKIRRNMATSEWSDLHDQISRKEARVQDRAGKEVTDEHLVDILDLLDRSETYLKSASLRYAVIVGADNRMWLELQGLPGSAKLLNSKPAFTG